ncbi:MAG: NAD(P)-dependent oxidoreductase [Acidobacteriota bacterium]|nr:NAD(P)-dependent oxidoreductase [Acidobacteriota bacterium]
MTILITGATGFIGSHVLRLAVRAGCEVHAIVRENADCWRISDIAPQVRIHAGELQDADFVEEAIAACRPSLCIHHAWYSEPGKYLDSTSNLAALDYTIQLANILAEYGCRRFAGIGTCFEYEHGFGYLSERTPANPLTLYAACKHSASLILAQLARQSGMEFAWLRLFYQYGPFEDPRRIVPYVIHTLLKDQPALLSSGEQNRDFLHVEDVASVIWTAATSNIVGNVNVGSGSPITIAALATQIGNIMGKPDLIRLGAKAKTPYDPPFIVANTMRLREIGWQPKFDVESGLTHSIEWVRQRLTATGITRAAGHSA